MILAGLVVTFLGFLIAFASLGITASVNVRLIMVLAGICTSLFGILGVINRAYLKNPIWKR